MFVFCQEQVKLASMKCCCFCLSFLIVIEESYTVVWSVEDVPLGSGKVC